MDYEAASIPQQGWPVMRSLAGQVGLDVRADVEEFLPQIATPGINFACRAHDFGQVSAWVFAGKSPELLRELDTAIFATVKAWREKHKDQLGPQAARSGGEGRGWSLDRDDGRGEVPASFNTK